jgi:hypothetical protein
MANMSDNPDDDVRMNMNPFDPVDYPQASSQDIICMNTAYGIRIGRGELPFDAINAVVNAWVPGASVQNLI